MATAGVFNGTSLIVYVGTNVVAHATSCSLSVSADLPDATTKDSGGWAEEIAGLRSWSMTTDGLAVVSGTDYNVEDLYALVSGRTEVTLKFTTNNGGTAVVGDAKWTGDAFIESLDMTADMESPVTFSASFKGTGALVLGVNA